MKKEVYFIRHAETDYDEIEPNENILQSCFAPLTGSGKIEAEHIKDKITTFDKVIFSSPYTRAVETAYSFAGSTPVWIDRHLHEWLPSKSYKIKAGDFRNINKIYLANNGNLPPDNPDIDYETKEEMKSRMQKVIDEHTKVSDKIILVCHARLISAFLDCDEPKFCQILKYEFDI